MSIRNMGRHRSADVTSTMLLVDAAKHHAAPTVKVAGVAAASGGMVIAAAMPAVAAPAAPAAAATTGTFATVGSPVAKKSTVKRKKSRVKRKRTLRKRTSRSYKRSYRRSKVRRVNRRYVRVSRAKVRRSIARPVVKKRVNRAPRRAVGGGVLRTAASLSGIYYRWGGTTPAGFDCSGYVGYVFRANGKHLPRTARAQQRATRRVSNPRPGDLVFFGSPAYHVGIYAGGGMMYDAPRTGRTTGLHKIWSSRVTYGRA